MSFVNASAPSGQSWPDYVYLAQNYVQENPRALILGLVNLPVVAFISAAVINILWQLLAPRDPSHPPLVFHWIPFFGSAAAYGDDPINFFLSCRKKYGNVFSFILLGRRVTVALGPHGNNFVTGGKASAMSAEDAYTHLTTPVFGKDVVYDCPNDLLMQQKKFMKVGLSMDTFRAYVGMIEDEVEHFLRNDPTFRIFQMNDINEWSEFDALKVMAEITILTASRTLQGKEVRNELDKTFSQLFTDLDGGFTPINWLFPNLPLESYRKRDRAQKKMSEFYIDIIRKRKARQTQSSEQEHDMIAALLGQKYRDGHVLQEHEIAHIMIALLMAGQHTSSTTLSWLCLHLADRPDITEAIYEEQVKHFSTPSGKLRSMTYDELRQLPLLDSVIRETLRMHPPIHSIMRKLREAVPVPPTLAAPSKDGTYVVPAGHFAFTSPAVSQVDPEVWKEPLKWDPYRWNDPEGVAAQAFNSYYTDSGEKVDFGFGAVSKGTESPYQPFGAGRHRCIGEQFAYLQIGTVVATIVRNLELRLDHPVPKPSYHTLITLPANPRNIIYRRRKFD